jgi:hypothetical protein
MVCSLRDAKNSSAVSVPYFWAMESPIKLKTKRKTIFTKTWEPFMAQVKNFFRKFPFTGTPKTSTPSRFCSL